VDSYVRHRWGVYHFAARAVVVAVFLFLWYDVDAPLEGQQQDSTLYVHTCADFGTVGCPLEWFEFLCVVLDLARMESVLKSPLITFVDDLTHVGRAEDGPAQLNEEGEIFGPFDWSDVAQLDFDNKALWEAMTADMKFWLEEVNIDGFRCDVAGLVPVAFWEYAKQELIEAKDDIWMLAENEDVPALMNTAFDANYGWGIHAMSNQIVEKRKERR